MDAGFKYLASPYSDPDPMIREQRYLAAASALQTLLSNKIWAYSPIVHCHELSKLWGLPSDAEFWRDYDAAMIRASDGIFVLRLDGWAKSIGVTGEIKLASELNKSITYLMPGSLFDAASTVVLNQDPSKSSAEGIR